MIRGITFSEQTFKSKDFAHFQNFFLNNACGITKGCSISQDGTKVTIGTGYFFVKGRFMEIEEAEVVQASQGFATGYNRIVYEIDLSKENTVTEFRQGYIKVLNTEDLVQEDIDGSGQVYQFPFCHFQWSGSAITNMVTDAAVLDIENILEVIAGDYETYQQQFEAWFGGEITDLEAWITQQMTTLTNWVNNQKQTIEDMIADLEAEGYARTFTRTATVGTNWVEGEGCFTQEIEVEGLLASDDPILDIVASIENREAEQEAWGLIFDGVPAANKLTLYADEATETALNLTIKVVR